jgi:hypothetical protein
MLHSARRAKALGLHYEARLRGLELCAINLTSTKLKPYTIIGKPSAR